MNGEGISVEDGGNLVEVETNGGRIRTLQQLIKSAKIDLKTWDIERHVINKWEVGAKDANNNIVVEPLWQVKVWLVKKQPVPIEPVLQPIVFGFDIPQVFRPTSLTGYQRALGLFDPHFGFMNNGGELVPFHDRRALDVALQIAQMGSFDEVHWGGDIADLAEWSDKFVRSPAFYFMTQPAVVEGSWWLGQFRQATPGAEHSAEEGNHDYRMRSMLMTHLMAAYQLKPAHEMQLTGVLSVPRLFGLDQLGIRWVEGYPDSVAWLSDYLCVEHGDIASGVPGATAGKMLAKGPVSRAFGHIHRREQASTAVNDRDGSREITAVCPGCLCRVDGVVPGHKRKQKWQQGVVVMHYNGRGEQAFEIVPIKDGRAIYQGKVIKARQDIDERVAAIGKAAGWDLVRYQGAW